MNENSGLFDPQFVVRPIVNVNFALHFSILPYVSQTEAFQDLSCAQELWCGHKTEKSKQKIFVSRLNY